MRERLKILGSRTVRQFQVFGRGELQAKSVVAVGSGALFEGIGTDGSRDCPPQAL
jgi:hypothetical protein